MALNIQAIWPNWGWPGLLDIWFFDATHKNWLQYDILQLYVLHRLRCLRQLKEEKFSWLQNQLINYNNINIKKEPDKKTKQTNEIKEDKLD